MHIIQFAATSEQIAATFPVMRQLRPHIDEAGYVSAVNTLRQEAGYHLLALQAGGRVVAAAGFRISTSLAWGRHVYIDDLISDESERSHGYGKALLEWIEQYGQQQGCTQLHLDSGVQRHAAHRFYLRERMDITCFHFAKRLG